MDNIKFKYNEFIKNKLNEYDIKNMINIDNINYSDDNKIEYKEKNNLQNVVKDKDNNVVNLNKIVSYAEKFLGDVKNTPHEMSDRDNIVEKLNYLQSVVRNQSNISVGGGLGRKEVEKVISASLSGSDESILDLYGYVNELSASDLELHGYVNELSASLSGSGESILDLYGYVDELSASLSGSGESILDLYGYVNELSASDLELHGYVNELSASLSDSGESILDLYGYVNELSASDSIHDLSDVNDTIPNNGYILSYLSANNYWDSVPLNNITSSSDGKYKLLIVGDIENGNYSEIEGDGTLKFHGDATVWDDLFFPASQTKQGANLKPVYDFTENGLLFPQNDETENIYILVQFPHSWKTGSVISPHIHYVQSVSAQPKFVMMYRYAYIGDNWDGGYTSAVTTSGIIPYVSGSIHQLIVFPDIDLSSFVSSNVGVSSMMDVIIYRQTGDGVVGDVLFKQFDIHYEIDTIGSRTEFIK